MQDMNFPPLLFTEQYSTGIECGFFARFEFPTTCDFCIQNSTVPVLNVVSLQDLNFPPLLYTEQYSTGIECGFFARFEFPATCVYTEQY